MAEEPFYDKVARKFGASGPQVKHITVYPEGDPELLFEQKIVELSSKEKVALDMGCGKGAFTLHMAAHFREIMGIDTSVESLKYALEQQQEQGTTNARFEIQDAKHTGFAANLFDLVYSRRGPTSYHECYRVLKPGGYMLRIDIGEKDAWDLKKVFGRGQGFWEWKTTAQELAMQQLEQAGFSVVYGQNFSYDEYYASYEDLDRFLQSVPIFQDFDSQKDRAFLETYVGSFKRDQGILLPRHRFITVAQKPA